MGSRSHGLRGAPCARHALFCPVQLVSGRSPMVAHREAAVAALEVWSPPARRVQVPHARTRDYGLAPARLARHACCASAPAAPPASAPGHTRRACRRVAKTSPPYTAPDWRWCLSDGRRCSTPPWLRSTSSSGRWARSCYCTWVGLRDHGSGGSRVWLLRRWQL